jgi:hypothetical protein
MGDAIVCTGCPARQVPIDLRQIILKLSAGRCRIAVKSRFAPIGSRKSKVPAVVDSLPSGTRGLYSLAFYLFAAPRRILFPNAIHSSQTLNWLIPAPARKLSP